MSPGRAKLFADAAVKKFEEQQRLGGSPSRHARRSIGRSRLIVVSIIIAAAILASLLALRRGPTRAGDPKPVADVRLGSNVPALLAHAAAALAEDRLVAPPGDNALEIYLQILARNPSDAEGRAGLAEVHERLLAHAENALLEERLDDAAAAIATAHRAGVENGRIAFLSAQLVKSREQSKAAPPAQHARPEVHLAAAKATDDALLRTLSLAAERLQENRLIEPDHDSANYYVRQALAVDPTNGPAQAAGQLLGAALLAQAHTAVDHKEFATAEKILSAADGLASATNVDNLRRLMDGVRQQAEAEVRPTPVVLPSKPDPVDDPVDTAAKSSPESFVADIVPAADLKLLKSVPPSYPTRAALLGIEGWVELDFTVADNGAVKNIAVRAANPKGAFEAAAISALSHWKYQPVLLNGNRVAQRARIRIRFKLGQ